MAMVTNLMELETRVRQKIAQLVAWHSPGAARSYDGDSIRDTVVALDALEVGLVAILRHDWNCGHYGWQCSPEHLDRIAKLEALAGK